MPVTRSTPQTLRGAPERDIGEVLRIVRLDGQKGKRTAHYSLGMKQRRGLAAALVAGRVVIQAIAGHLKKALERGARRWR